MADDNLPEEILTVIRIMSRQMGSCCVDHKMNNFFKAKTRGHPCKVYA